MKPVHLGIFLISMLVLFVALAVFVTDVEARCIGEACSSSVSVNATPVIFGKPTSSRPRLPVLYTKTPAPTVVVMPTQVLPTPYPVLPCVGVCRPRIY